MRFLHFLAGVLIGIYTMNYIAENRINIFLKVLFIYIIITLIATL